MQVLAPHCGGSVFESFRVLRVRFKKMETFNGHRMGLQTTLAKLYSIHRPRHRIGTGIYRATPELRFGPPVNARGPTE